MASIRPWTPRFFRNYRFPDDVTALCMVRSEQGNDWRESPVRAAAILYAVPVMATATAPTVCSSWNVAVSCDGCAGSSIHLDVRTGGGGTASGPGPPSIRRRTCHGHCRRELKRGSDARLLARERHDLRLGTPSAATCCPNASSC